MWSSKLAQSLVSRIGGSPLWRAGLASAFILGLAGFAAIVIPTACRNNFVVCQETGPGIMTETVGDQLTSPTGEPTLLPAVVAEATPVEPAPAPAAEPAKDAVTAARSLATAMINQEPASLTSNDLIAQTFAALDVGLTTASGELTARKVRTVSIGPDGMPVFADGQAADEPLAAPAPLVVAEAETAPEPEPTPAPAASAPKAKPEPVAQEDEPTASAYAPVGKGSATIGRQGANIRSLPKTGGSQVLFSLAAGEEVTVTETQKGWYKVVDDRGRSGWVWSELVRR